MSVDLDRLKPRTQVRFPGLDELVTLVAVAPGAYWEFYFDGPSGPGRRVLAESELDVIQISDEPDELRFDGDPLQFRLGVEAQRIDVAFAYEMAAVAVSNIQPLPHQLEAVYECFLREPRLRFLLADDPGAGKTIMAGLYMKELILRRAGDRLLVVTPANLRPQWIRELSERFQLDFVQLGASQFDASLTENPWDQLDHIVVSRDFLRTRPGAGSVRRRGEGLGPGRGRRGARLHDRRSTARAHQQEERTVQGGRSGCAPQPPAGPDDGHAALGAECQPVGLLRLLDMDAWGDRCPRKIEVPPQQFRKVSKEIMRDMSGEQAVQGTPPQAR